jgi:hypothetical protein
MGNSSRSGQSPACGLRSAAYISPLLYRLPGIDAAAAQVTITTGWSTRFCPTPGRSSTGAMPSGRRRSGRG